MPNDNVVVNSKPRNQWFVEYVWSKIYTLAGVKPSSSIPVLTQSSLHKAVEQLAHQIAMLQGILKATDTEINQLSQEQ